MKWRGKKGKELKVHCPLSIGKPQPWPLINKCSSCPAFVSLVFGRGVKCNGSVVKILEDQNARS